MSPHQAADKIAEILNRRHHGLGIVVGLFDFNNAIGVAWRKGGKRFGCRVLGTWPMIDKPARVERAAMAVSRRIITSLTQRKRKTWGATKARAAKRMGSSR